MTMEVVASVVGELRTALGTQYGEHVAAVVEREGSELVVGAVGSHEYSSVVPAFYLALRQSVDVVHCSHDHEVSFHLFIYMSAIVERIEVKVGSGGGKGECVPMLVYRFHRGRHGELAVRVDFLKIVAKRWCVGSLCGFVGLTDFVCSHRRGLYGDPADIASEIVCPIAVGTYGNLAFGSYHEEVVLLPYQFPIAEDTFHPSVEGDCPHLPLALSSLHLLRRPTTLE